MFEGGNLWNLKKINKLASRLRGKVEFLELPLSAGKRCCNDPKNGSYPISKAIN